MSKPDPLTPFERAVIEKLDFQCAALVVVQNRLRGIVIAVFGVCAYLAARFLGLVP